MGPTYNFKELAEGGIQNTLIKIINYRGLLFSDSSKHDNDFINNHRKIDDELSVKKTLRLPFYLYVWDKMKIVLRFLTIFTYFLPPILTSPLVYFFPK